MPRNYSVAVVALASGAPPKWVDNLLSQHPLPGIRSARRGVAREIDEAGALAVMVTRRLHVDLEITVARAVECARDIVASTESPARVQVGDGISISIDVAALEQQLRHSIVAAMEGFIQPRRGRPRSNE